MKMMSNNRHNTAQCLGAIFTGLALVLILSACTHSPHKNYYLLNAPALSQSAEINQTVGIGPIDIADYLKRQHIAYLNQTERLIIAGNDYWAEPLDKGIARVIGLNLAQQNPHWGTVNFPWRNDSKPDYSLRLQLHSLAYGDNQASINATWEVFNNSAHKVVQQQHFIGSIKSAGDMQSLTQAYSQLLQQLSQTMASALPKTTAAD